MKHKLTIGVSNASPKSRVVTYKKVSLEAKVKDVIGNTIFNFIILKLLFYCPLYIIIIVLKMGDKMIKANEIINECLSYEGEREWFEFKENWFEKDQLGEYISSLSNSAAILGKECAYMIWGIKDFDHKIVGTSFNYEIEINNEPLKHYLARNLSPSIHFYFF